jgi:hypothetical protein
MQRYAYVMGISLYIISLLQNFTQIAREWKYEPYPIFPFLGEKGGF